MGSNKKFQMIMKLINQTESYDWYYTIDQSDGADWWPANFDCLPLFAGTVSSPSDDTLDHQHNQASTRGGLQLEMSSKNSSH